MDTDAKSASRSKLTKTVVDRLEPRSAVYEVRDPEITGYVIRVHPSGSKTAAIRYVIDGRERRLALGKVNPTFTAHEARTEAARLLREAQHGRDPAAEKKARREAPTVAEAAERWFEEHAKVHNKPATQRTQRQILDDHLIPALGRVRVRAVDRELVDRWHRGLTNSSARRKRALSGTSANRCLAALSTIMNRAELWGWREPGSNPCRGLKRFRERRIERFLSPAERARLEKVLIEAECAKPGSQQHVSPAAITAIRLLSMTGARFSEVADLRWEHVDLDAGVLRLDDSKEMKTGEATKTVYLAEAVELLRRLHETREPGCPWVCPSRNGKRAGNIRRSWRTLRKRAQIEDVRLHDLRHSFVSDLVAAGVPLMTVGKLCGHRSVLTTQRYAHLADDVLRAAAEQGGRAIAARTEAGREVVDLAQRRKQARAAGDA